MDILLAMAVVPAAVLLWYVYKLDPAEKEPPKLLARLLMWGAIACIPAILLETIGMEGIMGGRSAVTIPDLLFENFIIVAFSEELCKFVFLRWKTWKNPAFDYVFDAVVYAVFVSLGFAILENIGYVAEYGMATAVVRAFTAIPGHAIFGVFMGCFYGLAKRAQHAGQGGQKMLYLACALIVPLFCHGFYDFCASIDNEFANLAFFVFLIVLMVVAMRLVKHMSKVARPVQAQMHAQMQAQAPQVPTAYPYNMPYVGMSPNAGMGAETGYANQSYTPTNPYVNQGYNPNASHNQNIPVNND